MTAGTGVQVFWVLLAFWTLMAPLVGPSCFLLCLLALLGYSVFS